MADRVKIHPFIRALRMMFPDVQFILLEEQPWFSMTFAGQRIRVRTEIQVGANFENLTEAEFHIPGRLVADLATMRLNDTALEIEALILEE